MSGRARGRRALSGLYAATVCALLLGAGPAPDPEAWAEAAGAWLDGNARAALPALARMRPSRERDLSLAVVSLYQGDAEEAERLLLELRAREKTWVPGLRWLARAQGTLERPAASETALSLVKLSDATNQDLRWAARLFAERQELARARDAYRKAVGAEADLYPAWTGLAAVETALGHLDAAQVARARAGELYPGGPTPVLTPAGPLPTVPLRYRAKFLFIPLAKLTLAAAAPPEGHEEERVLSLEARSAGVGSLFHIDSRFESRLGRDGGLLQRRNLSSDPTTTRRQTVSEIDPATGGFEVRQVRDGFLAYDVLPSPSPARPYDGLSIVEAARAVARSGSPLSVLRIGDSGWKGTLIRRKGPERIRWQGRQVDTVCVEIGVASRGTAGLQGAVRLWISADERAIPYRARMGVAIGSVTVELLAPDQES